MATTTISALTAVLAGDLDDTAVLPVDNNDVETRKVTIAQLRTQINTGAQTFTGAVVAQSTLAVTGASTLAALSATTGAFSSTVTGGTYNGQTISSAAILTGSLAVAAITSTGYLSVIVTGTANIAKFGRTGGEPSLFIDSGNLSSDMIGLSSTRGLLFMTGVATQYDVNKIALKLDEDRNAILGTAAIATTATNGFLYLTTCAGAPTGAPTVYTGRSAIIYDTTNNKFWAYNGSWRGVVVA